LEIIIFTTINIIIIITMPINSLPRVSDNTQVAQAALELEYPNNAGTKVLSSGLKRPGV
jgi:hypothetical protein